jgi:hypothetical protein
MSTGVATALLCSQRVTVRGQCYGFISQYQGLNAGLFISLVYHTQTASRVDTTIVQGDKCTAAWTHVSQNLSMTDSTESAYH